MKNWKRRKKSRNKAMFPCLHPRGRHHETGMTNGWQNGFLK